MSIDNYEDHKNNTLASAQIKKKPNKGPYLLGETLGEGAFAKVRLATQIHIKEKCAIKIVDKRLLDDERDIQRLCKEIKILKNIRHKNIVQLFDIMESKTNLYFVMEYCKGGELFDYIVKNKRLTEKVACNFFQQIIDGVEYLHNQGIIHRDLKPENLLLDYKNQIKISDFGLSTFYTKNNFLQTACGTPSYAPPEMLDGQQYNGEASDIWSCGIILYAMLCGTLPFTESKEEIIVKKIKTHDYVIPSYLSKDAQDILNKILKINPEERLTINDIKKHPWFQIVQPHLIKGISLKDVIIPVDENILNMVKDAGFDKEECRQLLLKNKFCSLTTIYYLCLKKYLREGGKSISDLESDLYEQYINDEKNYKKEEKIENGENGENNKEKNKENCKENCKENNNNLDVRGSPRNSNTNKNKEKDAIQKSSFVLVNKINKNPDQQANNKKDNSNKNNIDKKKNNNFSSNPNSHNHTSNKQNMQIRKPKKGNVLIKGNIIKPKPKENDKKNQFKNTNNNTQKLQSNNPIHTNTNININNKPSLNHTQKINEYNPKKPKPKKSQNQIMIKINTGNKKLNSPSNRKYRHTNTSTGATLNQSNGHGSLEVGTSNVNLNIKNIINNKSIKKNNNNINGINNKKRNSQVQKLFNGQRSPIRYIEDDHTMNNINSKTNSLLNSFNAKNKSLERNTYNSISNTNTILNNITENKNNNQKNSNATSCPSKENYLLRSSENKNNIVFALGVNSEHINLNKLIQEQSKAKEAYQNYRNCLREKTGDVRNKSSPFPLIQFGLEKDSNKDIEDYLILDSAKPINVINYIAKRLVSSSFCGSFSLQYSGGKNFQVNRRKSQMNGKNSLVSNGNLMINKDSVPINEEIEFNNEINNKKNKKNEDSSDKDIENNCGENDSNENNNDDKEDANDINFKNLVSILNQKFKNYITKNRDYERYKDIDNNANSNNNSNSKNKNNISNFFIKNINMNSGKKMSLTNSNNKNNPNYIDLTSSANKNKLFDFKAKELYSSSFNKQFSNDYFSQNNIDNYSYNINDMTTHYNKLLDISTNYDAGLESKGEYSNERGGSTNKKELRNLSFSNDKKQNNRSNKKNDKHKYNTNYIAVKDVNSGYSTSLNKYNKNFNVISEDDELKDLNKSAMKKIKGNKVNKNKYNYAEKKVSINLSMTFNNSSKKDNNKKV